MTPPNEMPKHVWIEPWEIVPDNNGTQYTRTSLVKAKLDAAEKMAEALEKMHSDSRLVTGNYSYQCGFLDALNSAKEALAAWRGVKEGK